MDKTRSDKMRASKEARRLQMQSQTVVISKDWQIRRADPLNWEILHKGKTKGYFGSIVSALKALPARMLNEEAKNTLAEVLRSVNSISAMIEKAIPAG